MIILYSCSTSASRISGSEQNFTSDTKLRGQGVFINISLMKAVIKGVARIFGRGVLSGVKQ